MLFIYLKNDCHFNILEWNDEKTVAQIITLQGIKYFRIKFIFQMTRCLLNQL